jgi:hypothetical protein
MAVTGTSMGCRPATSHCAPSKRWPRTIDVDIDATRGSSLFSAGTRCELTVGHRPSGDRNHHGDVNGVVETSLYSQ